MAIDEGTISKNMSDEKLDDLVLLVNKLRGKKDEKGEEKVRKSFAMMVTNSITKESSAQTRKMN